MCRLYCNTNDRKWKVISTEGNSGMNMRKLDVLITAMLLVCHRLLYV